MTAGTDGPPGGSLGRVVALGAYILDVLGRPVDTIPPGQASVRLEEIKATASLLNARVQLLAVRGELLPTLIAGGR